MRAASTGSPASTRLTKLTPLTTRPFFTSRQGMMRVLSIAIALQHFDGFRQVDAAVVERAPADHARDARRFLDLERLEVGDARHATRGDHRRGQLVGEVDG